MTLQFVLMRRVKMRTVSGSSVLQILHQWVRSLLQHQLNDIIEAFFNGHMQRRALLVGIHFDIQPVEDFLASLCRGLLAQETRDSLSRTHTSSFEELLTSGLQLTSSARELVLDLERRAARADYHLRELNPSLCLRVKQ
jgi:hypothetical protein